MSGLPIFCVGGTLLSAFCQPTVKIRGEASRPSLQAGNGMKGGRDGR